MVFIQLDKIIQEREALKSSWNSQKPFKYLQMDNFLVLDNAERVLNEFPEVDNKSWDSKTYINQKNKFQISQFSSESIFNKLFNELNDKKFLDEIEFITGIESLIPDKTLFGGGLHQSITGAFLDVHVDYNIHPETKQHRRLNIIVYMNKDWDDKYEGHLELWDMDNEKKLASISPIFNRMVMFETNEISFHGHPLPLKTPKGVTRKSLAAYYYTHERPESETANEHNTIYVNTQGFKGKIKNVFSGIKALFERIR